MLDIIIGTVAGFVASVVLSAMMGPSVVERFIPRPALLRHNITGKVRNEK